MIPNTRTNRRTALGSTSQAGWADYRAGLTLYLANYDRLPPSEQRNYERGRLRAANVACAFGRVPPKQTTALITRAHTLVGRY